MFTINFMKRKKEIKDSKDEEVNTLKYCDTIKLKEDPLIIQKKLKEEWKDVKHFIDRKNALEKESLILITKGMRQAKLASAGKFKGRSAKSFLNEL